MGWTALTGSDQASWTADLVGCQMNVTLVAGNGSSTATDSASISFAPLDVTPDGLAFVELTGQASGTTVVSDTATVTDFEGPLSITFTSTADTPQFSIDGGSWQAITAAGTTATINPGDTLQLSLKASGTETIVLMAGTVQATWTVGAVPAHGKQIFAASGSFAVPAGVTEITAKVWGGGGGANSGYSTGRAGGAGGFTTATLPVSPGSELSVTVATGGMGVTNVRYAGGGGGASGISDGSTPLIIAGGGGGAGHGNGGSGGGASGLGCSNQPSGVCGGVGTQTAGGAGGSGGGINGQPGSGMNGGDGAGNKGWIAAGGTGIGNGGRGYYDSNGAGGGGGGGGYFGGGGGTGGNNAGTAGGGGSGYLGSGSGSFATSSTSAAPASSDEDYVAGVAVGGVNGLVNGGDGLIVISW
jgi:hypothetical protein